MTSARSHFQKTLILKSMEGTIKEIHIKNIFHVTSAQRHFQVAMIGKSMEETALERFK